MITFIIPIITALTALLVAFAVIFRRHQRLSNVAFSVSILSTAVVVMGDGMCILKPELVLQWQRVVFIGEAVMAPAWLLFALSFARVKYWESINKFSKTLVVVSPVLVIFCLMFPIESFFYSPEFSVEKVLFLDNFGYTFKLILLFYSIMAIVNLEATMKSSTGLDRWQLKYTLIGVGGLLAINIFYYSHALLYRSINMNLVPVKAGIIWVSIMFVGFSLLRRKVMDVEVTVSRKVVYRSLSVFVVGLYLLGLGILGEGMRYFGPNIGENITIFLGFAGAIVIVAVILSEQLRRKVIVLINKNFYSQKYDYREQWLQFTQLISLKHSFGELLGAIAEGFQGTIGSRGASIWLKGGTGEFSCVKDQDDDSVHLMPDESILSFLVDTQWVLNVHDSQCRETVFRSKEFIEKNRVFLLVPLLHVNELIGFIILREALAETEYNYEDYDLLKTLARQATAAILNARLSEELIEAKEMEAMGRISSFVIHDLKNASSALSLLAQNAEEHMDNPDFQKDAIKAIVNSSEKIKGITLKLKNLPRKRTLVFEDHDLCMCVKSALGEFKLSGDARISFKEKEPVTIRCDSEEILKVVLNLIINALDATGRKGNIDVEVGKEKSMAYIKVSDDGCGISREFIDTSLFRPFKTSKKKGLGIGLYQCKTIIEEHSGTIKVVSEEGKGTVFTICLPINEHEA